MQVSVDRLAEVRKELAQLQDQLQPLQLRYQQEKARLNAVRELQQKKDDLQVKLEQAELRMDLAIAADIKWVPSPPAPRFLPEHEATPVNLLLYAFCSTQTTLCKCINVVSPHAKWNDCICTIHRAMSYASLA